STTDADARLARKSDGQAAKLCYAGHVVIGCGHCPQPAHGLVVAAKATLATGTAEREAARDLMARLARTRRATLGADKNYDTRGCVADLRDLGVTPHVAQHTKGRRSAIDGRTTLRAAAYNLIRLPKLLGAAA
ncbi:MAG: IS5/IS1182 family transposase, partial [Acetobacteraceae bacterium]|nr:IS5/IS1182 family transposase [Acetobacteraceae bacterium]